MSTFRFLAGCIVMASLALVSCENDLKDVEKISSKSLAVPVDKSYGVTIIYSDSAKVKAKLLAPELDYYRTTSPYYEMPKGLTIIFLDEKQQESSRVVSDYGVRREKEKLVELRKNVVVTNKKKETFKSDELIWDENRKIFYSKKLVNITKPDGTNIFGTGFQSDETFSNTVIESATGNLATGDKLTY